ncbi:MAG TPA: RelA/SpoT domain-containing protein [Thermoanaerobaculia bacterium]|nr:RelA/SpoT domain-containing protein [Thermoanaerobaculia bacterium]
MSRTTWAYPKYTRKEDDHAGKELAAGGSSAEWLNALHVVDNWRASHAFPLNTFQVGLRQRARKVEAESIVAQRLKRLSSIEAKLSRFDKMRLSRMQDIGGCRAVVHTLPQVGALHKAYRESNLKHRLIRVRDYIELPKQSGYRSLHLIYSYHSDKKPTYNGLQIEVQIRTQLQHAWATAVETVGTFLDQSLKSSQGSQRWLRFFSLMGSAFAFKEEMPLVPGTPDNRESLVEDIRRMAQELAVRRTLRDYQRVVQTHIIPSLREADFFLLTLRPKEGSATVTTFARKELEKATEEYLEMERQIAGEPGSQTVLVAAESVEALLKAYPNYFLDTTIFLEELSGVLAPPGVKGNSQI